MSMLMSRTGKVCGVAACGLLAPVLLAGAPAGAQEAPAQAAAAPSVDWTMDLSTLTLFDIQGKIDTDLCADVYGKVTVEQGSEKHTVWQRPRNKTLQVCEENRPLGDGEQSGRESLNRKVHYSSKAGDTRPWKRRARRSSARSPAPWPLPARCCSADTTPKAASSTWAAPPPSPRRQVWRSPTGFL
ncbi:hypothetical protein ABCR94_33915 [Streptomyces sp. 21So2-11]|uniref:hypothetical protein n=1 Tax=Streptomyces sp. 21So2-11 TaxID=3144408 RepID=UPI00321AFCE7